MHTILPNSKVSFILSFHEKPKSMFQGLKKNNNKTTNANGSPSLEIECPFTLSLRVLDLNLFTLFMWCLFYFFKDLLIHF